MTFKEHIENEMKRLSKEWQEDILRDIKNLESEKTMEQRLQELKKNNIFCKRLQYREF